MADEWKWQRVNFPRQWKPVKITKVLRNPPPHFNHTENFEKPLPGRHLGADEEQTLTSFWLAPGHWRVLVLGCLVDEHPGDFSVVEMELRIHAEPSDYDPQVANHHGVVESARAPIDATLHVRSTHPMLVTVTAIGGIQLPCYLDELQVHAIQE